MRSQARDDADDHVRDKGFFAKVLPPENIGDMDLYGRYIYGQQSVSYGYAGVGVGRGIYDYKIDLTHGRIYLVYDLAFGV